MNRALELAQNGLGNVNPNPLVGCVIVHNDIIIGEGWHQKFGEAHAEVNAIKSVKNKQLLKDSNLYVTLEPCSHYGKTPPCSDLIIQKKIPKVVICNLDPFDKVNGSGIEKLKNNGVGVEVGVLKEKGRELNRRFFTFIEKKRPYIVLKWAQTADGFVARENFDSKWISNDESRKLVHKMRAEEDTVLVGFNAAKHDNPSLTTRDWKGKNPIRVVIDKNLDLSLDLKIFDNSANTICFNAVKNESKGRNEFKKINFNCLEESILSELYKKNIQSLIIEGGSKTLQRFIDKNLWDEAYVFESKNNFEYGIKIPKLKAELIRQENVMDDTLKMYRNV